MTYIYSKIAVLMLLLLPLIGYANDPEGWALLKETIANTSFSDVAQLRNRTFDLIVPGATDEYEFTVQPEDAFRVDRLGFEKFRLTIVNPEALVKKDLIYTYYPIGWELRKKETIAPSITGQGNCTYSIVFSQNGVGELDLSKFGPDYEVTHELSNPQSLSLVERQGKGYNITRKPNSTVESKIRLRIKKKSGDVDLQTDWIAIPACGTTVTVTTPPVFYDPEPPVINPVDLLDIEITSISFCEDATGQYCSTLQVTATNRSQSTIRCNEIWFNMTYNGAILASQSQWVELNGGQSTTFQIVLKAPYQPGNGWSYQIKKKYCFYK